jgi:predicted RNA binding protein YcfA (HicA-like mRNA interferase family)
LASLRPLPLRDVLGKLHRAGFLKVSQRGSHIKLRSTDGAKIVIVPPHAEIAVGTMRSILRQAGLSVEEFLQL